MFLSEMNKKTKKEQNVFFVLCSTSFLEEGNAAGGRSVV